MSIVRTAMTVLCALMLGGCASELRTQRESARQQAYVEAAGAPVNSFRFSSLYSWVPLGESRLAVYTRPNEAWLLDLSGPCQNLPFANGIGLTSSLNQVMVRFDRVIVDRSPFPCSIAQIRPIDVKQVKAAQEQQRKISSKPRDTSQATP
ncbi:MAG: DUF6491 family protein [Rhodanobacter sp.]